MHRTGRFPAALAVALAAAALAAPQAAAQIPGGRGNPMGVWLERIHAPRYAPGALFQIAVTIAAAGEGTINAMGLRETVPAGWTLAGVEASIGDPPDIASPAGASGVLEFAWITPPALPHTFAYTLAVPEGESGRKYFHGALEYRTTGGALFAAPLVTETEGPAALAPVITLRGDNPASLTVGGVWEDPGYMAVDAGNQDITAKVVVSGAVDTATPGAYEVVYEVPAEGDTPAARKVRAVNVGAADDPAEPIAPAAPGTVIAPPGDPRETSNAIAATTEANPLNAPAKPPMPVAPPPPGFRRPHLPDISALRPDLTPPGGEAAAATPAPAGPAATETTPPGAPSGTDPAAAAAAVSGQTPAEPPAPAQAPAPVETAAPPAPAVSVNPRVAALVAGVVLGLLAAALLAARQVYGGGRRRRR